MKKSYNTTAMSDEAEKAALKFNAKMQFGIPDLESWLRTAYYHGYRDALVRERLPQLSQETSGGKA